MNDQEAIFKTLVILKKIIEETHDKNTEHLFNILRQYVYEYHYADWVRYNHFKEQEDSIKINFKNEMNLPFKLMQSVPN